MNVQLLPLNYSHSCINHRGLELAVYQWGSPSPTLPTMVFLHGWLDHGTSWNSTALYLVELGYHCIAIDHRGHGRSGHIPLYEEYHFPDYISDLQAILKSLTLDHFVLVGHSMGGTIASLYGAFCLPKAAKIVLIDGLGPKHEEPDEARHRLHLHFRQRNLISKHKPMSIDIGTKKLKRAHPFLNESSIHLEFFELTLPTEHNPDKMIWRWDPRHRNKAAIGFDLRRYLNILEWIDVRTEVIFGKNSWYLQLPDIPERIKHISDCGHSTVLPSGHSPHLECPELLANTLHQVIHST